jgi:hypothetical protein
MKPLLRIFDLSKSEQRVVLIVILALVAAAFAAYEHRTRRVSAQPVALGTPQPSPNPMKNEDTQ